MNESDSKAAIAGSNEFTPALSSAFKERLRPCLNALDALRAQGLQREISLPAVAVVGDQSVGKSSVLEAISGVEFPRGTGIVTRCPLMLSMRGSEASAWKAKIQYEDTKENNVEKSLASPAEIGAAIKEAQNEMTNSTAEISNKLIKLDIEGPDTPELTIIDLPGIARYSAELGSRVAEITKSLILQFIEKPEVIILVVIPCHVDIETVEALSLAKEVDPDSSRTIGVLTCPDLVNPGSESEVLAMMRNQKIVLRKGFVSVRCRTPQQLKDNVTLRDASKEEEQFFKAHKHFSILDPYEYGSKTLAVKLSSELYNVIKRNVPEMLKEIQSKREDYTIQLEQLGNGPPEDETEMKRLLVNLFNRFTTQFTNVATGTHRHESDRLHGRCRLHWERLADDFEALAFSEKGDAAEFWKQTRREIFEQRGSELPGFDNVFPVLQRIVVTKFLAFIKEPCSAFLVSVNQEVDETIRNLADEIFADYPVLNEHVKRLCESIRSRMLVLARNHIKDIFIQEEYIFTQDRIFVREKQFRDVEESSKKRDKKQAASQPDQVDPRTDQVLAGVQCYVSVAVRRMQDTIPMAVMHHLLHKLSSELSEQLTMMVIDTQPLFDKLHAENPAVTSKRRNLRERLKNLSLAEQELAKF